MKRTTALLILSLCLLPSCFSAKRPATHSSLAETAQSAAQPEDQRTPAQPANQRTAAKQPETKRQAQHRERREVQAQSGRAAAPPEDQRTPAQPANQRTKNQRPATSHRSERNQKGIGVQPVIIDYRGFTVSYSPELLIPLWVSYELTAAETDGPYTRKGKNFRPDETLGLAQADNEDYRNSGWTRGHMAPAADFKWDEDAMWDTFHYTNCCPQDASLNNGQWNTLENKVRASANKYGLVRVITGPIVGTNVHGTIGPHRVVVPDAFFKALLADTPSGPQTIAIVMQNQPHNENMQRCALSVNDLEALTGFDFFSDLDDSIEETVESSFTLGTWGL